MIGSIPRRTSRCRSGLESYPAVGDQPIGVFSRPLWYASRQALQSESHRSGQAPRTAMPNERVKRTGLGIFSSSSRVPARCSPPLTRMVVSR